MKLENLSDTSFESIKVEISSDLLDKTESWSCQLEPCKAVAKNFGVKPTIAGEELVQLRIIAKQGNSVYAYWADTGLFVFEKTKDLRNISIQANKLVDIGGVGEGRGIPIFAQLCPKSARKPCPNTIQLPQKANQRTGSN